MADGFLLRIKYVKQGPLAYLSHLETIRSIERTIRRASLPYAVSEGFNPHMKITFGAALPVGAASYGEYVDLRLKEYIAPQKILKMLQEQSAPALMVQDCWYISMQDAAASNAFPLSEWCALVQGTTKQELQNALDNLCERGFIEVQRKNKKPKTVSFEGRLVEGPVLTDKGESGIEVSFTTLARADGSLRPDRFLQAAFEDLDAPKLVYLTRVSQKELEE